MSLRFVPILAAILFYLPSAMAEEEANRATILFSWTPSPGSCEEQGIQSVPLEALLAHSENYMGTCIRTEGYYKARALFLRKRDTRLKYPSSNEKSADRRIGIYADDETWKDIEGAEGQRIEVSGRVNDCDALHSPETLMVMGYCHYTGGPIIGLLPKP